MGERAPVWGWSTEDGGPRRHQTVPGALGAASGSPLEVTFRAAPVATMVVAGAGGSLLLLRHTVGEPARALVERIDPVSLEPLVVSPELAAGPVWPGGIGVHPNGDAYVTFGNHVHRLDDELRPRASRCLPRERPYNSFVLLGDGHLVTKDFAGSRPGTPVEAQGREPCELLVLEPERLQIVDRLVLPEPSIARLSATLDEVIVVGDTSVLVVRWDGVHLVLDPDRTVPYRTLPGQGYGWDCVVHDRTAWLLDDGEGSERYDGTLRGKGVATAPLHLLRVDLDSRAVDMVEVCGRPGGLVANPPVIDVDRAIAVAYDSGNGVVAAFDAVTLEPRWRREQDHGGHLLLYTGSGELVTGDHAAVVVLDVETGDELARADTGSGMQSVLFPCPGPDGSFYSCAFPGVTRVAAAGAAAAAPVAS